MPLPDSIAAYLDRQAFRWSRTTEPRGLWMPGNERGFLLVPQLDWAFKANSQSAVRPAVNFGDSLTPGNNSKGTYVQLFTAGEVARDVWGILISINSGNSSTFARDIIVDIGYDPAGGSSYTVRIPDLLGSCAGAWQGSLDGMGGVWYYFPLFFPAGCTIAARASVNNATVGTVRVWARLFGQPRRPELVRMGQFCTAVGIVSASSRGTTVTSGTTSEGAWTALGTPTLSHWWWQVGFGVNDGTMTNLAYFADLSYDDGAGNNRVLVEDELIITSAGEAVAKPLGHHFGYQAIAPANLAIEGRLQCSGTADAGLSMAAYGVGG